MEVGTRSAEECQEQHTAQTGPKVTMSAQVTTKAKKKKNKKEAPQKEQPGKTVYFNKEKNTTNTWFGEVIGENL